MGKLKITQIRSHVNRREPQKRTIEALGLGKIRRAVVHEDTPQIRGMLRAVAHLIVVEVVS
jgi:large subunit ribosomal protein L30